MSPQPSLHYQVAIPQPQSHYFEISLTIQGWQAAQLELKFPVWTPGSYLVREYERHLQAFQVLALDDNQPLPYRKQSKNHWQIESGGHTAIQVRYRLYADELTVRTNHLDYSHGFFTGAATFFYLPGYETCPSLLTVIPPCPDWRVTTALLQKDFQADNGAVTFEVKDFDTLVDCPVEVGTHHYREFTVADKPHYWAVWGQGNLDLDRLVTDTQKIIETEAEIFKGLPYDDYTFLLHLSNGGFGGLEHKNSCVLNYDRFNFRDPEKYQRFLQLVAHEFFHLWNVKRIRPIALEQFDYGQENYTPSLWFSEGTTSYYDLMIPLRAGLYNRQAYLKKLGQEITRYRTTPGRKVQPVTEASYDAWIKLYRRDANSENSQISYYLKGEMITLLLDLMIRDRHQNQRSFDDVLRQLWTEHGQSETGFTPDQLEAIISRVADYDLRDFFQCYLHTTAELPLGEWLERFGLAIKAAKQEQIPRLGIKVRAEGGLTRITYVVTDSPAARVGISPQDILLAINHVRVNAEQLGQRLKDYQPNDMIQLTVFHQDVLRTVDVTLAEPQPSCYEVLPLASPSPTQQQNLTGWLGAA